MKRVHLFFLLSLGCSSASCIPLFPVHIDYSSRTTRQCCSRWWTMSRRRPSFSVNESFPSNMVCANAHTNMGASGLKQEAAAFIIPISNLGLCISTSCLLAPDLPTPLSSQKWLNLMWSGWVRWGKVRWGLVWFGYYLRAKYAYHQLQDR